MTEVLRFAVLGLGAGACYGLAAQGIVLVYRGSGVVNFANGAVGMVCAFFFYNSRESGTPTWLAFVLALLLGAGIGVAVHFAMMRPLRRAPALSRLIATLGLFTALYAFAVNRYGFNIRIVTKLIEPQPVEVLPDISIGRDRVALLLVGVVLTVVLTAVYHHTRFGHATTAVAESRRATAAQGISPDRVAAVNWAVGCALGALAAILIVNLSGLQVVTLTLLIVPALAAALVGSFRSFWLTLVGGLLIGIMQSEIAYLQVKLPDTDLAGWGASVPFLVIIIVLVVRGRALPLRGDAVERPPEVGSGRVRWPLVAPAVAGAVALVLFVASGDIVRSVTTTSAVAVIALSLVVVTGYAGQLSLAQYALAGMGAWIAAKLVADAGFPFELALLAGVLGAVPVGVLVGLPALRTRGVNLAVATLGLALVIESQVLNHPVRSGGFLGIQIGKPSLFGADLDAVAHPERYAAFAFGAFCVLALLVANLRRSRAGRRLIAVRTNERAAAALGIGVFGAKLYAFGLAAAIAAVGGVLIAFQRSTVVFYPTFSIFQSIFVVVYAVIGGIGYVSGALLGGIVAPGNFLTTVSGDFLADDQAVQIALGILLIVVLVVLPNGLAALHLPTRVVERVRRRRARPRVIPLEAEPVSRVEPITLETSDIAVRFGGVQAVSDVSVSLRPGEVLGLIGPNGAGKTTFIDAVTGFVNARGRVILAGRDVTKWSARKRARAGLGRSFQSLELFETMTVYENLRAASDRRDPLAYLIGLLHPGDDALSPAAVAAIREFGLEGDLDRRPPELPYGRRRLVAIARAVAAGPSVLLLDEPAAGLDDQESEELGRLVRRLADEWGLAVLMVEHDVALVLRVCDRVTVLDEGAVLASGSPDEIRHDPSVVAAYLGEPLTDRTPRAQPRAPAGTATTAEPSVAPLVTAHGLWAGHGDLAAVRDLDLTVEAGEIVALLGPNGAGKTTTLLTVAGELPPLRGDLRVLGQAGGKVPLQRLVRRGMGFVPEERAVISSLTTSANLRLSRGDTATALELFPELRPLLRRRAGLLSGGEQQMLTLARALASNPRLLLVDELSLGLAPLVVRRLLLAVRAAADRGVGVLLVEQHAADALDIADRVVVLRHGEVVLTGTSEVLRAQVGDLETAYLTGAPTPITDP